MQPAPLDVTSPFALSAREDFYMLMSVVTREFEEHGFEFTPSEDGDACSLTIPGESAEYTAHVAVDDVAEQIIVLVVAPQRIPVASRMTACEYVVRVNQGLRLGGFDLDMNDGEFRFRIGIDVEGGEFVGTMLRTMFRLASASMDAYHDGMLRVAFGNIRAEDAAAEAVAAIQRAVESPAPAPDHAVDIDSILRELEADFQMDQQKNKQMNKQQHQPQIAEPHRGELHGDRTTD